MFLSVKLLSDNAVESKHDIASSLIVVFDPILDVVVVEGVLGYVIPSRDDVTVGSFGGNLDLRVFPIGERLYNGVTPLSLGEEIVLHGWTPDHVVGSVENGNEARE